MLIALEVRFELDALTKKWQFYFKHFYFFYFMSFALVILLAFLVSIRVGFPWLGVWHCILLSSLCKPLNWMKRKCSAWKWLFWHNQFLPLRRNPEIDAHSSVIYFWFSFYGFVDRMWSNFAHITQHNTHNTMYFFPFAHIYGSIFISLILLTFHRNAIPLFCNARFCFVLRLDVFICMFIYSILWKPSTE